MLALIRHQLTLIICALIVLTLVLTWMISFYLVSSDYEKRMQENNSLMAESLAFNITQFMQNAYNINEMLATASDTVDFEPHTQQALLSQVVSKYSVFELLAVHQLNGDQTARSSGVLANRAERWWFKKFLNERQNYISNTYYSVFSESPITTIVHGIYREGELIGILMADIQIRELQQMVERYNSGAGSYAYLLDGSGTVIAHPDKQQVAELYNYNTMKKSILKRDANGNVILDEKGNQLTEEMEFSIEPSLQDIVKKVMTGETGIGEYTDFNGEKNICAYRTISLPGNSEPWSLIVVQRKNAALAFLENMTIKTVFTGVLMLAFSVLLAAWFSRKISNPLTEIVNVTNRIKQGDLNVQLQIQSSNELGILAVNFNQMISELKQHRERLEELVEARTGELAAANQEMIAMNETLEKTNSLLAEENDARRLTQENLLLRERQYRAITSLLTRPVDEIEDLLESILHNAAQMLKAADGYIGLYDDETKAILIHYAIGIHEDMLMEHQTCEEGMRGQVYKSGELFYVEDYKVYPERLDDSRLDCLTSVIMLPLKLAGKVAGLLTISWSDKIRQISKEDIAVLQQFGDLASIALERANTQKKIRQMAFYDMLTGLPNRGSLNLYLEEKLENLGSVQAEGTILFIDIDDLKTVNDNFGHSFGDKVIIEASRHIIETVGENAFVANVGGDEFIVVLPGESNREKVAVIADKVVGALFQEYEISVERIHMSASIGVVVYPEDGERVEDLLKKADSAMYSAKKAGRNCWRFYEPALTKEAYEKMILTNSLHRALERDEFLLYYQPQFDVAGKFVVGFEALLRWKSSEHGFVSPDKFIPLAEQSGLILPIGQWVLKEACRFARRLKDMGKEEIHVSVNISPRQLNAEDFVTVVRSSIDEAGILPGQIEIEITESFLIESLDDSVSKLEQLQDIGVMLSLDDFGKGYSSLTYLRSLPVGVLKIDKSFIDKIFKDETQLHVVGSIIDLGHTLGLKIVAEGVETHEQLKLLSEAGCDRIQGYIFSRPITTEAALKFIT